jgi:hypothetical protein
LARTVLLLGGDDSEEGLEEMGMRMATYTDRDDTFVRAERNANEVSEFARELEGRSLRSPSNVIEGASGAHAGGSQWVVPSAILEDRISPSLAGGITGLCGGIAGFAIVQGLRMSTLDGVMQAAAAARGVAPAMAYGVGYLTIAAIGALVGATFAVVTRYLRKWLPLLVWALVFFTSLALLVLAGSSAYGHGPSRELFGPILLASAVFGAAVSFSLPIRRRR